MREHHLHPFDPGISLQHQAIEVDGGNEPGNPVNEVDLAQARMNNDGNRFGWFEAVPLPVHRHTPPRTHQGGRYTPELVQQPPGPVASSPFDLPANNLAARYPQAPRHLADPLAFEAEVNPWVGDQGSAAMPALQHDILPGDRDFLNPIHRYGVLRQRGHKLSPIRPNFHHEDTQLPGIRQIFNFPMALPERASVQYHNHQAETIQTEEHSMVAESSSPAWKRRRESFDLQDPSDKLDSIQQSPPATIDHMSHLQHGVWANGMVHPAPKRRRRFPSGLFEIAPNPQEVYPTPKDPEEESAQHNHGPTQKPVSRLASRLAPTSKEIQAVSQARLIVNLASRPSSFMTQTAREVFNEEQCEKILWLALHGVSSQTIARLLSFDIKKPRSFERSSVVAGTDKLLQHFIADLATGQDRTKGADDMVEHLLQRGDRLGWSPYLLRQAVGTMSVSGDEATTRQERRENAMERQALLKWRNKHGGGNPAQDLSGKGRRQETLAFRGLVREVMEQEMIEQLGYREGTQEVERVLMKKWLLKIRELGKLPDRLDEAEVGGDDMGLEESGVSGDHETLFRLRGEATAHGWGREKPSKPELAIRLKSQQQP